MSKEKGETDLDPGPLLHVWRNGDLRATVLRDGRDDSGSLSGPSGEDVWAGELHMCPLPTRGGQGVTRL